MFVSSLLNARIKRIVYLAETITFMDFTSVVYRDKKFYEIPQERRVIKHSMLYTIFSLFYKHNLKGISLSPSLAKCDSC
jgi:hypothetical protein